MAPSQRGLGMVMKRGRNGRTARLNAPGVYINIEHVGVISCEPRQLASEVPKCKTIGFVEAPLGSPWFEALDTADCNQLIHLLQENSSRVMQKGAGGFTVLHAAAMRGCLKLLDQVFDLFKDNDQFVDEKEEIELSLQELLKAEHIPNVAEKGIGAAELTAAEYAWWCMGECEAREYLLHGGRLDSRPFVSYQSEILRSSITDSESEDEGSLSTRTLLLEVLADHRNLLPFTMRSEFEKDVEYNFVTDYEELRFHHACQNLRVCEAYVKAVIWGCVQKGQRVLTYLFQLRNAQGQTPLHVAVHKRTCFLLGGLIPGRESGENAECLNIRDCRGWTALHQASTDIVDPFPIRSLDAWEGRWEDGRADVNAAVEPRTYYVSFASATPLHLAVINKVSNAVELLLKDPRTNVNAFFHRHIYFDDNLYVSRYYLSDWTALQWAAVASLPEMVKILITCPRVKDVGKRQKHGGLNLIGIFHTEEISTIHLAAASEDPETLWLFITNQQF